MPSPQLLTVGDQFIFKGVSYEIYQIEAAANGPTVKAKDLSMPLAFGEVFESFTEVTGFEVALPKAEESSPLIPDEALEPETTVPPALLPDPAPDNPEEPACLAPKIDLDQFLANYRSLVIQPGRELWPSSTATRALANTKALRISQRIATEKRLATLEEQEALAQFSGWGGLGEAVFSVNYSNIAENYGEDGEPYWRQVYVDGDVDHPDFAKHQKYLKWLHRYGKDLHPSLGGIMTKEEWESAASSTVDAFFTTPEVISAMWQMARRLGFKGGRVLEPSAGVGNFLGLCPVDLLPHVRFTAVELDRLSGLILSQVYPDADVRICGFHEQHGIPLNAYDLVIGNVPFGDFSVYDKTRPEWSSWSVHNYFLAKSLTHLKPGGLLVSLTSRYTMDNVDDRVRRHLSGAAELIAALRLPNNAFSAVSTNVVSDILILQKRGGERAHPGHLFQNLAPIKVSSDSGDDDEEPREVRINSYFASNPHMVLGHHALNSGRYGPGNNTYTVTARDGQEITEALDQAIGHLPQEISSGCHREADLDEDELILAERAAKEGCLVMHDGSPYFVVNGLLEKPDWIKTTSKLRQALAYMDLKEATKHLIALQLNEHASDREIETARKKLNGAYDRYLSKYGPLNETRSSYLREDVEFPICAALEDVDSEFVTKTYKSGKRKGETYPAEEKTYKKASIFRERTCWPHKEPESVETVEDALNVSLTYRNKVDIGFIASLCGIDQDDALAELTGKDLIYQNPETGLWEIAARYLSGNVRSKLIAARNSGETYQRNVEALEKVQPEPLTIAEIYFRLGSSWIPTGIYEKFIQDLLEIEASVSCVPLKDQVVWTVTARGYYGQNAKNTSTWGLDTEFDALKLITAAIRQKTLVAYDIVKKEGGEDSKVRNEEKTLAIADRTEKINAEFIRWARADEETSIRLEGIYNERFNCYRLYEWPVPQIDHYPNASPAVRLRDVQKRAVSCGLAENFLAAHEAGVGKTYILLTLAMEQKRLELARKPVIVVQNSTVPQYLREANKLYPGAKALIPDTEARKGGQKGNRQRLLAQIALGDWDFVVLPHSFFDSLQVHPEREQNYIRERIQEIEHLCLTDEIKSDRSSRRELEKKKKRLVAKLDKLLDLDAEQMVWWEELGCDSLIIDEAHNYKRGEFVTNLTRVKGIECSSSKRATRTLLKIESITERTNGKNIILATGTPISNTMGEMWVLFRYFRSDLLTEFGCATFDEFAAMFGEVVTRLEEDPAGGFRIAQRFARYVNAAELLTMWRFGADVVFNDDVPEIKRPRLKNGCPTMINIPRSEYLGAVIEDIRQRWKAWRDDPGLRKDFPAGALVLYKEARQASIDPRMVVDGAPDEPDSKLNVAVENIYQRWLDSAEIRGTQFVFSDMRTGPGDFDLYQEVRKKLIEKGVPEHEVVDINDYKDDKKRQFFLENFRAGNMRIVIGHTATLGTGTDCATRAVAAHHLDVPLRPMDYEQRNARVVRQGNINPEVEIVVYGVKHTLDSCLFEMLQRKQKFINQIMRGNLKDRTFEDPCDDTQLTFEEMQAAISENPLLREKFACEDRIRKLKSLQDTHYQQKRSIRRQIERLKLITMPAIQDRLAFYRAFRSKIQGMFDASGKVENIEFGGISYRDKHNEVMGRLVETMKTEAMKKFDGLNPTDLYNSGRYGCLARSFREIAVNGLKLGVAVNVDQSRLDYQTYANFIESLKKFEGQYAISFSIAGLNEDPHRVASGSGLLMAFRNDIKRLLNSECEAIEQRLHEAQGNLKEQVSNFDRPFDHDEELVQCEYRLGEVIAELATACGANGNAGARNEQMAA